MKKIYYLCSAGLPSTAPGIRVDKMAEILERIGYEVCVICDREFDANEKNVADNVGATVVDTSDKLKATLLYKNRKYMYSWPEKRSKLQSLKNILDLCTGVKFAKRFINQCEVEKTHAVFIYDGHYSAAKKIASYCKKNGIKVFADVTEWYEYDKNKNISGKIVAKSVNRRITKLDHKLDGIIAISNYFEDYYKSKGANVVRIPPLMEIEKDLCIKKHEYYEGKSVLNFVYAGSPGGKDILIPFVKALQTVNKDGIKARLDVVGIDEKYFDKFDIEKNLKETGVIAHGRLSHDETLKIVKKADFGILFRHNKRYAKAGFSTKLAECMSVGVPMVCNKIGGSDLCITHLENGILTDTAEYNELVNVIETLVAIAEAQILEIKKNAYEYACDNFALHKYNDVVKTMMEC